MSRRTLIIDSVTHYWRTHLAVVAGVAVAVSVLAGALAVGDSVRASLRGLVEDRLGNTAFAIGGPGFFRDSLGCRNALYFDGAVSSLWEPGAKRLDQRAEIGPMVMILRRGGD